MWDVLDRALANLEAAQDITLTTARRYVIGHLCQALEQLGEREAATTVAAWQVFRHAGWPVDQDPGAYLGLARTVAGVAHAGDERHVALLLRTRPELRPADRGEPDDYLTLARKLVAACGAVDPAR